MSKLEQQLEFIKLIAGGAATEAQMENWANTLQQKNSDVKVQKPKTDKPLHKTSYANSLSGEKLSTVDLSTIGDLLSSWPKAVEDSLIIDQNNQESLKYRAVQVMSVLPMNIKGLNVLDMGCGSGHTAIEMACQAKSVTAYDINNPASDIKEKIPSNLSFADSLKDVETKGKFDLIVLYDVVDHTKGDPLELINKCKDLLKEDGVIFLRAHPWVSNTGGHLYETHNYAYLHLYLTPNEMSKLGYKLPYNIKVTRPMAVYEDWFKKANLKILSRKIKAQPIKDILKDEQILKRIIQVTWAGKMDEKQAVKILMNDTIDYVLKHA